MLQDFLNAPKTPAMQNAALLAAILVLLLCAPMIYSTASVYLYPYLVSQWGHDLAWVVNGLVWLIIFPILFFLLRGSLASSAGMAAMYFVDKVGLF
ncbi:MAG: hypothetical protein JJ858_17470 [Rhizobiaceae bacterium]|nr:hypothetical protein [Rhizobiaceae bacterium]